MIQQNISSEILISLSNFSYLLSIYFETPQLFPLKPYLGISEKNIVSTINGKGNALQAEKCQLFKTSWNISHYPSVEIVYPDRGILFVYETLVLYGTVVSQNKLNNQAG